ncbi:MAG: YqgE/AlgH family protein [Ghiorsea sp.]|nr:YqgE/AlgH family protein [Ghiorsea sp.]
MIDDITGKLLIATPSLGEGFFHDSVVLLCQHDDEGSMGLVLNKPQPINVFEVLNDMELFETERQKGMAQMRFEEQIVYEAGPVDAYRGFVLHELDKTYDSTLRISADFNLTTSKDILELIATGKGPERFNLLLGYAGWDAGQLEDELMQNDWLLATPTKDMIFNTPPEHMWSMAARGIGFERSQLSSQVGHA